MQKFPLALLFTFFLLPVARIQSKEVHYAMKTCIVGNIDTNVWAGVVTSTE